MAQETGQGSKQPPKEAENEDQTTLEWFISELTGNPVNVILLLAIFFLIYKILKPESEDKDDDVPPPIPPMKKRDFRPRELKEFDGSGPEGRVLVAVLGKVYDVTKGKHFYGPGGPYASFGGHDASRALATFNMTSVTEEHDDLSDLKPSEMEQVKEWEIQFSEKYPIVGKLLKPQEDPTVYTDDEEDVDEKEIEREERTLNPSKKRD